MITGLSDGEHACLTIASWGPDVFVTLGAEGACFASQSTLQRIPAFPAVARDTNGAGDLFAGGALFGLCRGYSPADAGRLGSYAASCVVQQTGARLAPEVTAAALRVLQEKSA
jgi:sugar/nucleoside kinase (ribokinase family)